MEPGPPKVEDEILQSWTAIVQSPTWDLRLMLAFNRRQTLRHQRCDCAVHDATVRRPQGKVLRTSVRAPRSSARSKLSRFGCETGVSVPDEP
jgi:hypothetical protein